MNTCAGCGFYAPRNDEIGACHRHSPTDEDGMWPPVAPGEGCGDFKPRGRDLVEVDIVFDGPPGPEAGRFVEVERDGKSISAGEWVKREDGYWVLRMGVLARDAGATPE